MASSSTSAVSIQQKQSAGSCSSSQRRDGNERRRSCDTVCSSNSSCFLQRRKPVHPLATPVRNAGSRIGGNVVRQRVLSAKLLRLKSIQSQLNDANFHLSELAKENRALRTLQKRQDKALNSYEDVNADLPRLIKSHEEERRVLQEKNKTLRKSLKEASEQLKAKDDELNHLRDQLKHLTTLTKDKRLGEREKLQEDLEEARERLKSTESQVSLLNRKLMLESKNSKHKYNNEVLKYKQSQKELMHALAEVDRLSGMMETGDKKLCLNGRKRFTNLSQRQVVSCTALSSESTPQLTTESARDETNSDVKLEPIVVKRTESNESLAGVLKSPTESIKARLSSGNSKEKSELATVLKKSNVDDDNKTRKVQLPKSIYTISTQNPSNRPNSSHKFDVVTEHLQTTLENSCNKDNDEGLGEYCMNVVSSVKTMNKVIDKHRDDFSASKSETQDLLDKLKEADALDSKLRQDKLATDDLDIVNKIWFEEYSFQKDNKGVKSTDKNGNLKDFEVSLEGKKKLLATLRAIDNGDSVESVESINGAASRKTKLMKELFGENSR